MFETFQDTSFKLHSIGNLASHEILVPLPQKPESQSEFLRYSMLPGKKNAQNLSG